MSFISIEKENVAHRNDVSKPSQIQKAQQPLCTISGSASNFEDLSPENQDYIHRYRSLFQVDSEDSDDCSLGDIDEIGRMLPGVLAEGIAYTVKQTIMQGYIEKKGSGSDWLRSKAWKQRWAVLVKARTDGHSVDVPLLQIFWDYHSPSPSTVISLDSAVVLPEIDDDASTSENNHSFRFQIQHLKKSVNPEHSVQLTRIFNCSDEEERNRWVYSINEALLNYEKEKAAANRRESGSLSPPRNLFRSWIREDIMPQSTKMRQRMVSSPPRIPLCSRRDILR